MVGRGSGFAEGVISRVCNAAVGLFQLNAHGHVSIAVHGLLNGGSLYCERLC